MVFSLRQLQENYRGQTLSQYVAFINLTKAFDLVSGKGFFTLLQKIGHPPKFLRMTTSFHEDMQGTVHSIDLPRTLSQSKVGRRKGYALAPTFFGIFFALLRSFTFIQSETEAMAVSSTWPAFMPKAKGDRFSCMRSCSLQMMQL